VDANHDGKVDAGEMKALTDYNIVELDLNASKSGAMDNGNLVGLVSSYKTADGSQHQMADVWFAKDVAPQKADDGKESVGLHDVLAPPTTPLLGGVEHLDLSKTAMLPHTPDIHAAALDRKLAEEDEQRRNASPWL
jgi:hypothetical protein